MKVFDYLDFNEFFDKENKFCANRPAFRLDASHHELIGDFEVILEMAQGVRPGSGSSAKIRLDDDDIIYLYQFMPQDWTKALWYRYGPGLINYAKVRHANIPQHRDEVDDDGKPTVFHGTFINPKNNKKDYRGEEHPENIVFDEDFLFGTSRQWRKLGKEARGEEPWDLSEKGKGNPLSWLVPEEGLRKNQTLSGNHEQPIKSRVKYLGIKFGWSDLYNKLNLKYGFDMTGIDTHYWDKEGTLPYLAGYKPLTYKNANDVWNKYLKYGIGLSSHQPQDHHHSMNAYQGWHWNEEKQEWERGTHDSTDKGVGAIGHQYGFEPELSTNDKRSPHEIMGISYTHGDPHWRQGKLGEKGAIEGSEYDNHIRELAARGLGRQSVEEGDIYHHPVYVSGKPGRGFDPSYSIYEMFGLHKSGKNNDWEVERYFPMQIHQAVFEALEKDAAKESERSKTMGISNKKMRSDVDIADEGIDGYDPKDFIEKCIKNKFYWEPMDQTTIDQLSKPDTTKEATQQKSHPYGETIMRARLAKSGEDILYKKAGDGNFYVRKENTMIPSLEDLNNALRGVKLVIPRWQWHFLQRFVNRFETKQTRRRTLANNSSVMNIGIESKYRAVTDPNSQNTKDNFKDAITGHAALDQATKHKEELNGQVAYRTTLAKTIRKLRDDGVAEPVALERAKKAAEIAKDKAISEQRRLRYETMKHRGDSQKTWKHQAAVEGSDKKPGKPAELEKKTFEYDPEKHGELPKADSNAVKAGGVWHLFGGPDGNIEILGKDNKWHKPKKPFKVFVPLLRRGQVLPSEQQLFKTIPIGAFGNSSVAEVETNHFSPNPSEDEGVIRDKKVADRIKERYDIDYQEKTEDGTGNPLYVFNRNDVFWAAAERGEHPPTEFYQGEGDHKEVIRGIDHSPDHIRKSQLDEESNDRVEYFSDECVGSWKNEGGNKSEFIRCGIPKGKGEGIPVLASVHAGVQDALNDPVIKNKPNIFAYYTGLVKPPGSKKYIQSGDTHIADLWSFGTQLLKDNVAHPQFFKNSDYEEHLGKEFEDLDKDEEGNLDVDLEGERNVLGLGSVATDKTGYSYRRKRVKEYIKSQTQRKLDENIPARHARETGQSVYHGGFADGQLESIMAVGDKNKHYEEESRKGIRRVVHDEAGTQASAQSTWLRKCQNYAVQKRKNPHGVFKGKDEKDSDNKQIKGGHLSNWEEVRATTNAALALWAIESHQVPTTIEIVQNKDQNQENQNYFQQERILTPQEATGTDIRESHPKLYKEALLIQNELARKWAKEHSDQDWKEREKQIADGDVKATSVFGNDPDADEWVAEHLDRDVVKNLINEPGRSDEIAIKKYLQGMIHYDLSQHHNLEDEKIGGDQGDEQYQKVYNAAFSNVENKIGKEGLTINYEYEEQQGDEGYVKRDEFQQRFHQATDATIPDVLSDPRPELLPYVHAVCDYLLNSINTKNINTKHKLESLEDAINANVNLVVDKLEESSQEEVKLLSKEFKNQSERRIRRIKEIISLNDIGSHLGHSKNRSGDGQYRRTVGRINQEIEDKVGADGGGGDAIALEKRREEYKKSYKVASKHFKESISKENIDAILNSELNQEAIGDALIDVTIPTIERNMEDPDFFKQMVKVLKYLSRHNSFRFKDEFEAKVKNEINYIQKTRKAV